MFIHSGPMNWPLAVCSHSRGAPHAASLSFDAVSHWGEYIAPRLPQTAVGVAHLALGYSQPRGWHPRTRT